MKDSIEFDPVKHFSAVGFSLFRAFANQSNMTLNYNLAYLSAFFRFPYTGNADDNYSGTADKTVEDYWNIQKWVSASDQELHRYLKSPGFNSSLADYTNSMLEFHRLTNGLYFPSIALLSYVDKYWGATLGAFLESQETAHDVAFQVDDVRLLHYFDIENHASSGLFSSSKNRKNTPLLVIYAPVNRYHIMDIRKGRSVIEHFTSEGFDVFLLDWGKQWHNGRSMSDYLSYIEQCIRKIKELTKVEKVSILGYSWGGILSLIYASSSDDAQKNIKNLILESVHVDFYRDDSILASWFRHLPIDEVAQNFNEIDCRFIDMALSMRNPLVHVFDPMIFAATMGDKWTGVNMQFWQDAFRTSAWLNDTPVIPSSFLKTLIGDLYQQNQLLEKRFKVMTNTEDGKKNKASEIIDLSKITVPTLNIIGDADDICPPAASLPIEDAISATDKDTIRLPCGHIELCVSTDAHQRLWPHAVKWLADRDSDKKQKREAEK